MRARHLQDVLVLLGLLFQLRRQIVERRRQLVPLVRQADLDRCRKGVVRRLRHVRMVVRRDDVVPSLRFADEFERTVRQYLVHVHVDRGARAALDRIDGELVEELSVDDLFRRFDERVADVLVETACLHVRLRRRFLHLCERLDEVGVELPPRDAEVLHGAHGLHPVVGLVRHSEFAEKIMFFPHRDTIPSFRKSSSFLYTLYNTFRLSSCRRRIFQKNLSLSADEQELLGAERGRRACRALCTRRYDGASSREYHDTYRFEICCGEEAASVI